MSVVHPHPDLQTLLAAEEPHEAEGRLRFSSRRGLVEHVRKHVLGTRAERWWDLLGQTAMDDARAAEREHGDATADPRFRRLAQAYESLLSDRLLAAVREGRRHVHIVTFEIGGPVSGEAPRLCYRPSRRIIVAWSAEEKLRIVAGFPVSDEVPAAYALWSGFRHDVKASVGRFTRSIRTRMLDRHRHHQERLVAIHDGEPNWGPESIK